jgi:D-alanine-D-alanine ligase
MHVGLTYDLRDDYLKKGFSEEETAEFDRLDTVEALEQALATCGCRTERIGSITELVSALAEGKRWDLVFNFAEGLYGSGREAQIPALLEAYRIPYTFSDPLVLSLSLDKGLTKRVVRDLGLPTPDFVVIEREEDIETVDLPFPLFTKPLAEGTSKGVSPRSKICSLAQLRDTCRFLLQKFSQPVLVETFLPGREFTVGLIGSREKSEAIGVLEVRLKDGAEKEIYSYANKENWETLVGYSLLSDTEEAAGSSLAQRCKSLAVQVWRGLGCRDAGRVDLRLTASGEVSFLEVNPLAGLHPHRSDLPILCTKLGISYTDLISRILQSACERRVATC